MIIELIGFFSNILLYSITDIIFTNYKVTKYNINLIYTSFHAITVLLYSLMHLYELDYDKYILISIFSISYCIYDILFIWFNNLPNIKQSILHHTIFCVIVGKMYLGYYNTPELMKLIILNYLTEITTPTLNLMLYLVKNKLIIKYTTLYTISSNITIVNFFIFRILNGIYINYTLYYTVYYTEFKIQFLLTTLNFIWFFKLINYKNKKYNNAFNEKNKIINKVERVFSLYENHGLSNYIGGNITQLEHAQHVALLASENKITNKPDIIIGAFLHDIGHLLLFENMHLEKMDNLGAMDHEIIGSNYLYSLNFPTRTCEIIKNHVNTKRYLLTKYPDYINNLSDSSKKTLVYQGGKMSDLEIETFQLDKNFRIHLNIRKFDEQSKNNKLENINYKPLSFYKNMAIELLLNS